MSFKKSNAYSWVFIVSITYGLYLAWMPLAFIFVGVASLAGALECLKKEEEEGEDA